MHRSTDKRSWDLGLCVQEVKKLHANQPLGSVFDSEVETFRWLTFTKSTRGWLSTVTGREVWSKYAKHSTPHFRLPLFMSFPINRSAGPISDFLRVEEAFFPVFLSLSRSPSCRTPEIHPQMKTTIQENKTTRRERVIPHGRNAVKKESMKVGSKY